MKKRRQESGSLHGQGRRFNPYSAHHLNQRGTRKKQVIPAASGSPSSSTDDDLSLPKNTDFYSEVGERWVNGKKVPAAWNDFWHSLAQPKPRRSARARASRRAA